MDRYLFDSDKGKLWAPPPEALVEVDDAPDDMDEVPQGGDGTGDGAEEGKAGGSSMPDRGSTSSKRRCVVVVWLCGCGILSSLCCPRHIGALVLLVAYWCTIVIADTILAP